MGFENYFLGRPQNDGMCSGNIFAMGVVFTHLILSERGNFIDKLKWSLVDLPCCELHPQQPHSYKNILPSQIVNAQDACSEEEKEQLMGR